MATELVADFRATVDAPPLPEPCPGRVLMRSDKVVCVTEHHQVNIPLAAVFDIGIGAVPRELQEYFDDSVTIAYEEGNARKQVVLEARANSMESFRTVLFKTLLTGKQVQIRYPANRGGHVLDTEYGLGRLVVTRGKLTIRRPESDLQIPLDAVTTFTRGRGTVGGVTQWLISVGILEGDTVVTARIAPGDERILKILSRYLKLGYSRIHHEVARMDLDEPGFQTLVALDAGSTKLQEVVPDVDDPNALIEMLKDKQLIKANGEAYVLTRRGRIAVKTHLETVN